MLHKDHSITNQTHELDWSAVFLDRRQEVIPHWSICDAFIDDSLKFQSQVIRPFQTVSLFRV